MGVGVHRLILDGCISVADLVVRLSMVDGGRSRSGDDRVGADDLGRFMVQTKSHQHRTKANTRDADRRGTLQDQPESDLYGDDACGHRSRPLDGRAFGNPDFSGFSMGDNRTIYPARGGRSAPEFWRAGRSLFSEHKALVRPFVR